MFASVRLLTGDDDCDVVSGKPDEEVYRYGAMIGELVWVSVGEDGSTKTVTVLGVCVV